MRKPKAILPLWMLLVVCLALVAAWVYYAFDYVKKDVLSRVATGEITNSPKFIKHAIEHDQNFSLVFFVPVVVVLFYAVFSLLRAGKYNRRLRKIIAKRK